MPGMRSYETTAAEDSPEGFVEQDSREREQATQGALAGSIPQATEPLKPGTIRSVQQTMLRVLKDLGATGKGQMAPPAFAAVTGPVDQVPPDLGALILGLAQFMDDNGETLPMLADYAFDPIEAMSSNAGLDGLTEVLDAMAQDEALAEALAAGPEEMAEEEEVEEMPEEEDDDVSELMPPEEA